ncbi:hypothetical protein CVT26_008269 [Gymnopilus dilepis]|uniref:F-box domain-containing protein n=1 Tax=Gymnopilus dilepis TaxID=231916 RepID=A0A409WPG9_9AGAR|nr:hypothetical protein CVT26_008269 [Gymnopilus dilepis]
MDIIVTRTDHEDGFGNKVQLIRKWIQRAQGRLLTISVQPPGESYCRHSPLSIFDLLAHHSTQWKDLYLHTTDDCIQILNNVTRRRIPCLETLHIERDRDSQRYGPPLDFLVDAPNLEILDYEEYDLPAASIRNPWPRLISLIAHGGFGYIEELRHSCPNLEHLRLWYHDVDLFSWPRSNFSRLKSLVLTKPGRIVRAFKAPVLESFARFDPSEYDFSFRDLRDFMDISGCDLRGFGIALRLNFEVESLQNLLYRTENVTSLYIGSYKASDYQSVVRRIPQMLDPRASGNDPRGILLPKLEVLQYYTIDPVRSMAMVDMIKNRWHGVEGLRGMGMAKLRRVRFTKWKEEVLAEQLKEEIEQGLIVTYDLSYDDDPFE